MSSGVHAVLLATKLCKTVNLFGFSHDPAGKWITRPAHYYYSKVPIARTVWSNNQWQFEAWLVRLLHLADAMTLCTSA
jgi:hypothetical protein